MYSTYCTTDELQKLTQHENTTLKVTICASIIYLTKTHWKVQEKYNKIMMVRWYFYDFRFVNILIERTAMYFKS